VRPPSCSTKILCGRKLVAVVGREAQGGKAETETEVRQTGAAQGRREERRRVKLGVKVTVERVGNEVKGKRWGSYRRRRKVAV
jgi:hypothetical protein